jgi:hypothetical protein
MSRYPNGRIPDNQLVKLGTEHFATPATAKRLANLIADVLAREGITLRVTGGPNIYRSLAWQKFYWNNLPYPQAAYPGTSSHGGVWNNRDCLAVDIDNWAQLGKTKFYYYANKHGFTTNVFDWEPWHIIDFNCWVMPAPSGGGSKPTPEAIPDEEEEDMKGAWYKNAKGQTIYIWFDTRSGFYMEINGVNPSDNNTIARYWGTGSWPELTASVADALNRKCAEVRQGK